MATTWSDEESLKLIELWGDEETQALLEGFSLNKHVYEKIAARMVEAGFERNMVQCRDKIKMLKGEYKKFKTITTKHRYNYGLEHASCGTHDQSRLFSSARTPPTAFDLLQCKHGPARHRIIVPKPCRAMPYSTV